MQLNWDLHTQFVYSLNQFLLDLLFHAINKTNLNTNPSSLSCVIPILSSQSHLEESDVALPSLCESGSRSMLKCVCATNYPTNPSTLLQLRAYTQAMIETSINTQDSSTHIAWNERNRLMEKIIDERTPLQSMRELGGVIHKR